MNDIFILFVYVTL
jgi:large subunit ribosomal protein LP1